MDANKYKHITSTTFAKVAPYSTRKTQVEMACAAENRCFLYATAYISDLYAIAYIDYLCAIA